MVHTEYKDSMNEATECGCVNETVDGAYWASDCTVEVEVAVGCRSGLAWSSVVIKICDAGETSVVTDVGACRTGENCF